MINRTTHPDTPDPRAGAPTPEPMSEARMEHLRSRATAIVESPRTNWGREHAVATLECLDEITRLRAVIAERDAEIGRLRGWFREITEDGPSSASGLIMYDVLRDIAQRALAGEAVPDER